MAAAGVLDFAGGIVVHITAGAGAWSAVHRPRKENKMVAGNLVLTVLGTGMLWVGWYGFNGGSASPRARTPRSRASRRRSPPRPPR